MKRLYSLKSRKLFRDIYKKGKRTQGKGIKIFVLKIEEKEYQYIDQLKLKNNENIYIGISINKRYGKANIRNKAKRIIRSICTEFLHDMNNGYCMILRPDERFKHIKYEESKAHIKSLLQKSGVID